MNFTVTVRLARGYRGADSRIGGRRRVDNGLNVPIVTVGGRPVASGRRLVPEIETTSPTRADDGTGTSMVGVEFCRQPSEVPRSVIVPSFFTAWTVAV